MTGQDFQDKLDAIVLDLQTAFPNHQASIPLRDANNSITVFTLSSNSGVLDANELASIQAFINNLKPKAEAYTTERAPVMTALDTFKTERASHQILIDDAAAARTALSTALEADVDYQAAKTALETARTDIDYVAAVSAYQVDNVSENYGNLSEAKGNYIAT